MQVFAPMKLKQSIWIIMGLDFALPPVDLDYCRPSGSAIFRGRARTHQVGDFSRVKRYSSVQTDLIKSFVEQQTNNPDKLMRILVVSFTLFALYTVNGCVSQGTYDAVVQEGLMTRSELDRIEEEHKALVRQANDLERINADSMREAETILVTEDAPICPLYYYVGIQFYDPERLGGIEANLLDEHPIKAMYWKKR